MIRVAWHWSHDPQPRVSDVRLAGRGYTGEDEVRLMVACTATGRAEDSLDVVVDGVSLTPLNERNGR